jgi:thiosulfate/3-mercaptopyruvate sulfurtransferase
MPVRTTQEIEASLGSTRTLLLDLRAHDRYLGRVEPIDPVAGHVPGAVSAPFLMHLLPDGRFRPLPELRQHYAALLAGRPAAEVVCMCGSGVTACHGIFALELAGWPGAALYVGSWSEWIRSADRPVARES